MFSKFLKFATGATMIALLGLNNANATGLTPGMTFGVGAEWMFGIKTNRDLSYTVGTTPVGTALVEEDLYSLDMKRDNGYGGSVSVGYLMDSGFEGGLEVLYKELKYKDAVSKSTLETTNLIGLLKGTYYIDLGSMIYPYITAGVGISHISAKGTLYRVPVAAAGATEFVKFTDMKANKLAGDAGIGIAAAMQSALFSVGVKASTNQNMEDSKSYTDMKVVDGAGDAFTSNSDFAFGRLTQMNYEVEAKLKVIMS